MSRIFKKMARIGKTRYEIRRRMHEIAKRIGTLTGDSCNRSSPRALALRMFEPIMKVFNSVERRTSRAPQLHPVRLRCSDQSILAEYGPSAQASGIAAVGPIVIISREFAEREVFIKTFYRRISGS